MRNRYRRGSALVTALVTLLVIFVIGSGVMSLSIQSMRRGRFDVLRRRTLALSEAGVQKALYYLRTTAPDGTTNGTWRTDGLTESINGQGDYTIVVQNGSGTNNGKVVITSTGHAVETQTVNASENPFADGAAAAQTQPAAYTNGPEMRRSLRVVVKLAREDVSIWNNAIFGGVGQAGKSINGNVQIDGSVHLLGEGESFTDLNGNGKWDAAEPFTDLNGNGKWDPGEPFVDTNGNGKWDDAEPFIDLNGNGVCDPPLTVTDLDSAFDGSAHIGNNYNGMPSDVFNVLPPLDYTSFGGENVQSLNAKLRAKHGQVSISGTATVGDVNVTGGSPAVKETLDGAFVSDGFTGNKGASSVYADNGTTAKYDLGDMIQFPDLVTPVKIGGVQYPDYMTYLRGISMVVPGPLTLQPGVPYGPVSDGNGNSLSVDANGNITISGIVYVNGDINIWPNPGSGKSMSYVGRGTLVSTGNLDVETSLLPANGNFPIVHAMGFIARKNMYVGVSSQLSLAGAFYAQQQIVSSKQNELAGTFVTSYFSMQNVPHMYQVPTLPDNLPPGMPGSGRIWVKTVRIDSWREIPVAGGVSI